MRDWMKVTATVVGSEHTALVTMSHHVLAPGLNELAEMFSGIKKTRLHHERLHKRPEGFTCSFPYP